jgi:flagellar motor protein MotB
MVLGLAMAGLGLTGCNSLKDENALLMEENQTLREELNNRNAALEAANLDLRDRTLQVSQLRRELESQPAQPAGGTPFDGIPGVTGTYAAGVVTAVVENDIMFDAGKTTLKSGAKQALDSVASILKTSYPGQEVRITGYTDTDPIKKSGFKTNYHLGFERAFAVQEYLISRGLEKKRVAIATYGPNRPLGTKAESRRVEIAVATQ